MCPDPKHGQGCPHRPSPVPAAILEPVWGRGPLASENGECGLLGGKLGDRGASGVQAGTGQRSLESYLSEATRESQSLNLLCVQQGLELPSLRVRSRGCDPLT